MLRLEKDVNAFLVVDLRGCHALIEEGAGQHALSIVTSRPLHMTRPKPARHNNLTTRRRTCTGWRFVPVTSWLPSHTRSPSRTQVPLRREAVDGQSHHWHYA